MDTLDLNKNNLGDGIKYIASALRLNPWLKTLNLNDNNLTHNNIKELTTALTENKALETLLISNNIEIGDLGFEAIANMLQKNNSLKKLALMNIKLGDLGAAYLATVFLYHKDHLQHIKELDLRDNNITNLGAESLKSIPVT
ncbi:leucine-rich repeat domain-containing protein [Rickettsia hoogstraalii]|uniref:hypothetical protein n=1 Tax=Rickettsia hoogstraalii TaxID=467174 RepID=UPI00396A9C60